MIGISFATVAVVVHRPEMVDDHGAQVPNYASTTEQPPVQGCVVQPAGTTEDLADKPATADALLVQAPVGSDVQRFDEIAAPGWPGRYRVVGEPVRWQSPLGTLDHLSFTAQKVKKTTKAVG